MAGEITNAVDTGHGGGVAAVDQVGVVEINGDNKVQRVVTCDAGDIDLARAELDARAASAQ
jgi:hypothetical protein